MTQPGLFGPLPERTSPEQPQPAGKARLREPVRDQIELRAMDLESLIADDHPARLIWAYVEKLDLSVLEDAIKSAKAIPVVRQRPPACFWACGFMRPARGSAVRGRWRGSVRATLPIVGCAVA